MKKILVVGGYGDVGRVAVAEVLKTASMDIVVAGRNLEKASDFVSKQKEPRLSTQQIGIYDSKTYEQ